MRGLKHHIVSLFIGISCLQTVPVSADEGRYPVVIFPNAISTEKVEFNTTQSSRVGYFLFTRADADFSNETIMVAHIDNETLLTVAPLDFVGGVTVSASDIFAGRDAFFFSSRQNISNLVGRKDANIYQTQSSDPALEMIRTPLPDSINSKWDEYYPVQVNNGNLYFSRSTKSTSLDIYVSKFVGGKYLEAQPISGEVNTHLMEADAWVSPDEKFMIFARMDAPDGLGVTDLYISLNEQGVWQTPQNLGERINSVGVDGSPSLSKDMKTLFFTSNRSSPDPLKFDGYLDLYRVPFDLNKWVPIKTKIHNRQ